MARKTFNVLFFIKKARLLKNGEAPVCMRITVNGCMVDVLVKRSCPVNLWNQAKENSKGKDRMSVELNHYLEITRSRIHQIYRELESAGKTITVDLMRKLYYGVDEDSKTLLQVFREHNEQNRKLIGKDFVSKTVQRYETTTRYLKEFIKKEYQLSDIALNNLEANFISKFDAFLKIEKGCAQNSSITRLKERLETLCAIEVDVKDMNKPKKGKVKQLCRYLRERVRPDKVETLGASPANPESKADTVYVSTGKIRRHLYRFYMSELRNCRICKNKRKEIRRYSLSYAHSQIFGVPANSPVLDDITVKDLKKKKQLTDKELDGLIQYFKERKENMAKKYGEEKITMEGQSYYYIASELLP